MAIFSTQQLSVGFTQGGETTTLLSNLNLSLESGELVALLGQNGAGKSTTIKSILGLVNPDKGKVSVFGKDAKDRYQMICDNAYRLDIDLL